jgi:hypothetical protein
MFGVNGGNIHEEFDSSIDGGKPMACGRWLMSLWLIADRQSLITPRRNVVVGVVHFINYHPERREALSAHPNVAYLAMLGWIHERVEERRVFNWPQEISSAGPLEIENHGRGTKRHTFEAYPHAEIQLY